MKGIIWFILVPLVSSALIDEHLKIRTLRNICEDEYLGTNQSVISRAYGFGQLDNHRSNCLRKLDINPFEVKTAWQSLSITQQLAIGVRAFQMEIYWFDGDFWVSSCAGMQTRIWQGLYMAVAKDTEDWDISTVGCAPELNHPRGIALTSIVDEFKLWICDNQSTVTPILLTLTTDFPIDKAFGNLATRNASAVSNQTPILLQNPDDRCGIVHWHHNSIVLGPFNCEGKLLAENDGNPLVGRSIKSFIWSWQQEGSYVANKGKHIIQGIVDGRWYRTNLVKSTPKACRSSDTLNRWGVWRLAIACPGGFKWDHPRTRKENDDLWKLAQQYDIKIGVWLFVNSE